MPASRLLFTAVTMVILSFPCLLTLQAQSLMDSAGCFNYSAYTNFDSSVGMYSFIRYETSASSMSPDRRYLATWLRTENYPSVGIFIDATALIDLATASFRRLIPYERYPKWSPDGARLLTWGALYFPDGDSIVQLPLLPNGTRMFMAEWSVDGKHLYNTAGNYLYRCDRNGGNVEYIGAYSYDTRPWTVDSMISIDTFAGDKPRFYRVFDLRTGLPDTVWAPELQPVRFFRNILFSRNRRFMVADAYLDVPLTEPSRVSVCMYDFKTHRLKEILPGQPFRIEYCPSWASDSTLLISYVCHLDSSYTTWEIDTNGVFLRRLTDKTMLPGFTGILDPRESPAESGILIYPSPATTSGTVELEIQRRGMYSITVCDVMGREVRGLRKYIRLEPGRHVIQLPLDGLVPGLYMLWLSSRENTPRHMPFVIRR